MFASRKYTLVATAAEGPDDTSSPSMTPYPSPTPAIRSPAMLLRRRSSSTKRQARFNNNEPLAVSACNDVDEDIGLPPVLFSSLSASILQDRRRTAVEAACTPQPVLISALSASLLKDKQEEQQRAALERTVRERISGRQRHPATIQRAGVEDRDPASLMVPLTVSSSAENEDNNVKERRLFTHQDNATTSTVTANPSSAWSLVRTIDPEARRRLAKRLEAMSRGTEVMTREMKQGKVDEEGGMLQGMRSFFQKIFASL